MLLWWAGAVALVWLLDYFGLWNDHLFWVAVGSGAATAFLVTFAMNK
jgi:Na+-driven multidrug efflux pump